MINLISKLAIIFPTSSSTEATDCNGDMEGLLLTHGVGP